MLVQGILHSNSSRIPTAAMESILDSIKLDAFLTKLFRATLYWRLIDSYNYLVFIIIVRKHVLTILSGCLFFPNLKVDSLFYYPIVSEPPSDCHVISVVRNVSSPLALHKWSNRIPNYGLVDQGQQIHALDIQITNPLLSCF